MSTTSVENSPSPSPVAPNAPKFGTLVPNRIFVGGISANTTETELHTLFSNYGNVKATKIISDRAGVSKGYGFVTFETEEEAKRIQKEADNIVLKDRKLNIAPAIKKQPFTRVYDPTQSASNGTIFYHNGMPYTYQNGMAFFTTPENLCQLSPPQQTAYSVIYPHPVYVPQQQFQYQTASTGLPTQYVYSALPTAASGSNATEICQYGGPIPNCSSPVNAQMASPYTQTNPSTEYADSSTADAPSSEVNKGYSKKYSTNNCGNSRKHPSLRKNSTTLGTSGAGDGPPHYQKSQQSQLIAKTVNGITVMAYPTPLFINTSQRATDHSIGDRDTFALVPMTDIGMIQQLSTNPINSLIPAVSDIVADCNGSQSKF
ncbi:protein boule-like isoform X2 [Centruroides vittatus]|uniref:protein boule-like isoform X2 n=1 Tax=Centruroides vittatus TaxID=120091 RepID=UPI00350F020F